jgi:signal transduction histidine kinase
VLETDLLAGLDGRGCSPMARSGMFIPLRARGRVVGIVAVEDTTRGRYGEDDLALLNGLAGPLALAVDNALWFLRLRRFGAEAERARIARDLHDRLAQSLAYIAFELERLAQRGADEDRKAMTELHEVVRGIVGELRETLYQLRAGVSEDADLDHVAAPYLARYEERTGVIVHWRSRVERHVPYQVEQELWRVLQEALTNIEHHAHATCCSIDYRVTADHVSLIIEDDGRGFDPSGISGDHYGLIGMRERADALGAHLVVESTPGQGARVSVQLEVKR